MMLVLALLVQGAVASPREAFARGEALYQEQRFDEAAEVYESMRAAGIEDGVVYYNLGNAYFKSGRLGPAVLSYERALKLLPGDEDARTNLLYANELVADSVEEAPLPLAVRFVVQAYRGLRPDFLAQVLSVFFLVGGVACSVTLHDAWPKWRSATLGVLAICVTLAAASAVALAFKLSEGANRRDAIVLSPNAYVRSGPGDANPRLAEIHEGLKVRVIGEREGWYQVTLANGLTGWIQQTELEGI